MRHDNEGVSGSQEESFKAMYLLQGSERSQVISE
jgi:hypothetical protein